jgi:hypothetical protein
VKLINGCVIAVQGLDDNHLAVTPERFDAATSAWSPLPVPGPIPMYAHLFLLDDGRIFDAGGQYGRNNGVRPSIWGTATGHTTGVFGLTIQRCAIRRPVCYPRRSKKVMILGGAGFDMHSPAPALADGRIVDLKDPASAYHAAAPMDRPRMH